MNKSFKLVWSESRKAFVTVNEFAKARGKRSSKAVLAVSAALTALFSMPAFAYDDPGVAGDKASWETEEYQKDWGLAAMHASDAYALGYHGQGIAVGVMDSGALMQVHPELAGDRFHAVKPEGQDYGSTGNRYPQHSAPDGMYAPGTPAPESGQWQKGMNDSHGTHVTGTVGGNRDGKEFHGVAWGSDVYVGNTGGTDDTNYGPFQDPQFFYQGWNAIASDISGANKFADGETRGGFINNSFGTNTRVDNNYNYGADNGNIGVHLPTNTVSETDFEYFLFMKDSQARKNADSRWEGKSFVDAAYEAVADKKVVQVFTTGNRDLANPFYRPLFPYFNPEAEQNWVAVAGMKQPDSNGNYPYYKTFNEAGLAKWWTVAAPGHNIYSSKVDDDGKPLNGNSSGTSMAAPHVTGALAVLMSRYDQMDALQVRDVMLTTATHKNPDGSNFDCWTAAEGEVDTRMGWGMPDLEKGMYGPGQFLGKFDYKMAEGSLDVWSNDIRQTALEQREREELAWKAAAEKWLANPVPVLGDDYTAEEKALIGDLVLKSETPVVGLSEEQQTISPEEAVEWRKAYYQKRLDAINAKTDGGLYKGSLVKRGGGTLVMTGSNFYTGGTTVEDGKLIGFTDSFGTGTVRVNGGAFGLVSKYQDDFTKKGELQVDSQTSHKANVEVGKDGTLLLAMRDEVEYGNLTLEDGAKILPSNLQDDDLDKLKAGETIEGGLTAEKITGADQGDVVKPYDYAFIDTELAVTDTSLRATLKKNEKTGADFADNANEAAAGAAFVSADEFLTSAADEIHGTIHSLGNPLHVNANANMMFTGSSVTKLLRDQASGRGAGEVAKISDGNGRFWMTGFGAFGDVSQTGFHDIDAKTGGVLLGLETDVTPDHTFGVMAGAGKTSLRAKEDGKISANDWYLGLYGESRASGFSLGYGVQYTIQDREATQTLQYGAAKARVTPDYKANMLSAYAELAYNVLKTEKAEVSPYAGVIYQHITADDFTSEVGGKKVKTEFEGQNAVLLTAGVRGALPFKAGAVDMKLKGDIGWNQYVSGRKAESRVTIGDKSAKIESEKLNGFGNVGIGLETAFSKTASLTVGYQGLIGSRFKSHGFGATVKVGF